MTDKTPERKFLGGSLHFRELPWNRECNGVEMMTRKDKTGKPEEKLARALVAEEEQPYLLPENWCWTRVRYLTEAGAQGRTALPAVEPLYLRRYFESGLFRSQAASAAEQDCMIPLPPAQEQRRIVACVEVLFAKLDSVEQGLGELADHEEGPKELFLREVLLEVRENKRLVLDRAFRGELRTNDPAEESGEELLKRLLAAGEGKK